MPLPAPTSDAARVAPYAADIQRAAEEEGLAPALLAAVGLRETLLGWAPGYAPRGTHLGFGDLGHGWGLWQADDRSWKAWILSPDALTPLGQARKAASEIAANLRLLRLTFQGQPGDLLERASVAAYNARLGAVAAQIMSGRDVDAPTTQENYSADVYRRAEQLTRAGLFPPRNV
jgi:hypothetical protein